MPKKLRAAVLFSAAALSLLLVHPACERRQAPPNVVLVVLDTLRRDAAVSRPGDEAWRGLTPALGRIAREGTEFTVALATAPWTVPSHASLFTGLLPSEHGCTHRRTRLDPGLPTLAEKLAAAGYDTVAVYSNPWLSDRATGLLRGFALRAVSDIGGLDSLESPSGDQGGEETLGHLSRWFAARPGEKPFFLFVNFLEPHLPYDPPGEVRRERLGDLVDGEKITINWAHRFNAGLIDPGSVEWERVRRLYGGDVAAVDSYLGRLVELLKSRGLYDDTVLIVTSDHGENFGDHGLVEHQFSVHETLLAVPLVIRAPRDILKPGKREDPVMLTDLYATILELGGVATGDLPAASRSLLGKPSPALRPLIAEYAPSPEKIIRVLRGLNPALDEERLMPGWRTLRLGRWRLTEGTDGSVFLHDMEEDPLQQKNVARERGDVAAELRNLLPPPARDTPGDGDPSPEMDARTREQLRSLGYVE